jgi:predicted TIM-barrel fold metal-dependent hydrolase
MKKCFRMMVCLGLAFGVTNSRGGIPAQDGGPPVPVIDVHTHVFNSRDLPLKGVLNALGAPSPIADILAKFFIGITPVDDAENAPSSSPGSSPSSLMSMPIITDSVTSLKAKADVRGEVLSDSDRAQLADFIGGSAKILVNQPMVHATSLDKGDLDRNLVAQALQKINFPPGCQSDPDAKTEKLLNMSSLNLGGYLDFIDIMTDGHMKITKQLQTVEYPDVDLFVHHMMDMAKAYNDTPTVPFDQQEVQMTKLDESSPGKFLHFVAYDPFRGQDSLASVIRGLDAGAVGVKFYPPSGYSATDNVFPPKPSGGNELARWNSRYSQFKDGHDIDVLNDALFTYCEQHDIPLFSHCTPGGFQADKNYGLKADSKFWEHVLQKHPHLRLCLAHSGGDDYWFAQGAPSEEDKPLREFGEKVVELCLEYPNVYCEVGYLEQILNSNAADIYTKKLAGLIDRDSTDTRDASLKWRFGDKIMYGTDWHMIHKEPGHRKYLACFQQVFRDPTLSPWQRAFFSRNAVTFLQLAKHADESRFSAEKAAWQDLVTRAEWKAPNR